MSLAPVASPAKVSVPFVDLRIQYHRLREEILLALEGVAESTGFVLGPRVAEFEKAFAGFTGARHCVAVNTGTSALHLALIAAGVKPGDEVITVPMTFIATSWGISYVGATPVFVDVDPATYTMDVDQVRKHITSKTKAILPVHLYGQPADMAPLLEIGREYELPVIEDAAQAHGATYQGKHAGTLGLCGCFSFYPGKNLGAYGEGGAIITDDDHMAKRFRSLRDHAQEERYHHAEIGYNYRMDAMQGAVLGIKLKHLVSWTESRRFLAERYLKHLVDLPIQLPAVGVDRSHAWHLFVILHANRDRLRQGLEKRGIASGLHYPIPLHLQKAYAYLGYTKGDFPVAEGIGRECLSLPLFPEMTIRQQDAVIEAVVDCIREESWN
jgi:dTDP-4-amino-4,6-dideoxygalactose transaminase